LLTFGNKNKNLYLPTVQTTFGQYQRPIPIIGKMGPIIGASLDTDIAVEN